MVLMNSAMPSPSLISGNSVKVEESLQGSMPWLPRSVTVEGSEDLASGLCMVGKPGWRLANGHKAGGIFPPFHLMPLQLVPLVPWSLLFCWYRLP